MNFISPNGDSDNGGDLYEPHEVNRGNEASDVNSKGGESIKLLSGKEKIQELESLLEERSLENEEMKI